MDYTVDSEWTDADIDNGKRRAYREYLIEVMEYSEKKCLYCSRDTL